MSNYSFHFLVSGQNVLSRMGSVFEETHDLSVSIILAAALGVFDKEKLFKASSIQHEEFIHRCTKMNNMMNWALH